MLKHHTRNTLLSALIIVSNVCLAGRSPWRPRDPLIPEISTCYEGDSKRYYLRDHYLELHPIFSKFKRDEFMKRLLPDEQIPYRNDPKKKVAAAELKKQIEVLLQELKKKKTKFTYFTVIKQSDYNPRLISGLIIVKFKQYPLILKLFLKTPETFIKQAEGLIPKFFYRMGGGTNRHLTGFTRVRNLEEVQKIVLESEKWNGKIDFPRKWFWLPAQPQWIEIRSKNIGPAGEQKTVIPAIYGVLADAIEADNSYSMFNDDNRETALAFAQFVENRVDAHADNFMIEKSTGKTVLIDTEHFPSMIGLKEPMKYDSYKSWYFQLSCKCLKDNFLRSKQLRRELQAKPRRELFPV